MNEPSKLKRFHKYAFFELILSLILTLFAAIITFYGLRSGTVLEIGLATKYLFSIHLPFWLPLVIYELVWSAIFVLGLLLERTTHIQYLAFSLMSIILIGRILDLLQDLLVGFSKYSLLGVAR